MAFIINAPLCLTGIWALVSTWISPPMRETIKILGKHYQDDSLRSSPATSFRNATEGPILCLSSEEERMLRNIAIRGLLENNQVGFGPDHVARGAACSACWIPAWTPSCTSPGWTRPCLWNHALRREWTAPGKNFERGLSCASSPCYERLIEYETSLIETWFRDGDPVYSFPAWTNIHIIWISHLGRLRSSNLPRLVVSNMQTPST
jgi:hypothetical protein